VLDVRDLTVAYGAASAVEGATFHIDAGELAGVLGESGSGKSTMARSLAGLLPRAARVVRGTVLFRGTDVLAEPESRLRAIRGAGISLIAQEPALALNPVMRAGTQVAEVIRAHRRWSAARCRSDAALVLEKLCGADAGRIFDAYPHQLSGGQRQRVAIAQAVALEPALVVADEPTASLDQGMQAEVLALLAGLKRFGCAVLLITHNPGNLTGIADRLLVMYAGRIVEQGPFADVSAAPLHPYTRALLACAPGSRHRGGLLPTIPGAPPDPAALPPGCPFAPRCTELMDACSRQDPTGLRVRCFHHAA
ncbi:MAG TPA: ABC transporter ATP-binding protein, partial [Bryobacteraceae bacterium]|nr:ABC transporter ATP-binding protein [Bryobacteraceae bacterium]